MAGVYLVKQTHAKPFKALVYRAKGHARPVSDRDRLGYGKSNHGQGCSAMEVLQVLPKILSSQLYNRRGLFYD